MKLPPLGSQLDHIYCRTFSVLCVPPLQFGATIGAKTTKHRAEKER
jgi:hypothetical protein